MVGGRRIEPWITWVSAAGLLLVGARFVTTGEPYWTVLALVLAGVAVLPPVVERDPSATMPGALVVLATVPVAVRASGSAPQATPFLAVAGIALLSAIALDAYTSLELTPRFAVVFVVVTTLAFAGVWTVATWTADALFDTGFVEDRTELMWDLVVATAAGGLAGVVFELYFEYGTRLTRQGEGGGGAEGNERRVDTEDDGAGARESAASGESKADLPGDSRHHRVAVRAMQALLAGIALYGLYLGEAKLLINSALPLAITFVPGILRREYDYPTSVGLTLWVTVAVTLHAIGALGPYESYGWYDSVTHTLSATLIAAVGYTLARAVELHTAAVEFDPEFRTAFVLLFVLAAGVAWELVEFASGGAAARLGGTAVLSQYGVGDIVNDLVFNTVGGIVVALLSAGRFDALARALAGRVDGLVRGG